MTHTVRQSVNDDHVGVVVLADPDRRNALRYEVSQDLGQAVRATLAAGARAVVLTAEPPVFCSGGSLDELLEPKAPLEELYAGFLAIARCPVPTIAAVGGACIGAGVNLPLACDVIVASPAARFDCRWLDVGIHPGGGHLRRLTDRAGRQAAVAMVLCGEVLDGEGAARIGMAWRCVPEEELLGVATGLAAVAARRDPELVRRTKASLDATLPQPPADAAVAVELEAQRWSMTRPGFRDGLLRLRERLAQRR
jgi:enoyl-CoA hydratase